MLAVISENSERLTITGIALFLSKNMMKISEKQVDSERELKQMWHLKTDLKLILMAGKSILVGQIEPSINSNIFRANVSPSTIYFTDEM